MWKITIYRIDSQTPIVYENVKHAWFEGDRFVVSQFADLSKDPKAHHYWVWPVARISHVKEERI